MKIAAVQMSSGSDREANIAKCAAFIAQAARDGAGLVVFPENVLFKGRDTGFRATASPVPGPVTDRLCELSRAHGVAVVWGAIVERAGTACHNTALFVLPDGTIGASYRKMHLFELYDGDTVCFREAELFEPGDDVVTLAHGGLEFGMSICYDLRFPELYREQVARGAGVLLIPSDFTRRTGQKHWLPLLQARAIENLSWVVAPNQSGVNGETGAESHGHTCIISPWGDVVAECDGENEGMCLADVTIEAVKDARARIRALEHRKL
ncbi:carbon-nitrogen hydrolase family protein [bacterium]|nr:carbon-nitrogen hydrolase family protein [bacterium]